jgi:quercetin dioxygenase-like cupin family protein
MTADEFSAELRRQGFHELVVVERGPGSLDTHSHAFESQALILTGEITLMIDGRETLYRPGDVFHLARGQEHCERYGYAGVRYLVGRK